MVASAKAITPILLVPLEVPAYFVSHGNEAGPQLMVVLQGYGMTLDLVGDTFIGIVGELVRISSNKGTPSRRSGGPLRTDVAARQVQCVDR